MAILDAADGTRTAEEHAVVDRHVAGEGVNRLGAKSDHEDVVKALPDIEVAAVIDAEAPILVVARR